MFRAETRATGRTPIDIELRTRRRDRTLAAALLSVCASLVVLWPYTAVIAAGPWSLISVVLIAVVVATGMILRLVRWGRFADGPLPVLAQLVVSIMAVTLLLVPQGALLSVIPTGTTLSTLGRLAMDAVEQVQFGTAPLADTASLRAVLGIGFAVIAILIDQLVAARFALPTILLVAFVGAIPMIITLGDANLPWFVLLALLALFLLRHSIRHGDQRQRRASTSVALSTGAAAIAAALVVTPVLPISSTWVGAGTSARIDPSLSLGEDLRRPTPFTVITLATDAPAAPYLRVATLSDFDGSTWSPDESTLQPVSDGFGGGLVRADRDRRTPHLDPYHRHLGVAAARAVRGDEGCRPRVGMAGDAPQPHRDIRAPGCCGRGLHGDLSDRGADAGADPGDVGVAAERCGCA